MDELVKKLAGFGIPAIILLVAMSATGLAGAAAFTAALAATPALKAVRRG